MKKIKGYFFITCCKLCTDVMIIKIRWLSGKNFMTLSEIDSRLWKKVNANGFTIALDSTINN